MEDFLMMFFLDPNAGIFYKNDYFIVLRMKISHFNGTRIGKFEGI